MSRARVAIVSTYYRPVVGGAESAAERLAAYLVRHGHETFVLTTLTSAAHPREETIDGVPVFRLGPAAERRGSGKWRAIGRIRRALEARAGAYDVICAIDYRGTGLAALTAGRRAGCPVVFQAQTEGVLSGAHLSWPQRLVSWPIRRRYTRADAFACISHGIEREAIAAGVPDDRVHYLPNPVDTSRFRPATPDERSAFRAQHDLPAGDPVAVFVGRLSREKGVMELIEAWRLAGLTNARLIVIGPAMARHPWDVSQSAADAVRAAGLSDRIRFAGSMPAGEVAAWLRAADLAIQPSHFESFGIAAVEAMASGLPIIASDTGGYRDFIKPAVNGWLTPPRDPAALSRVIREALHDPARLAAVGRAARESSLVFDEARVLGRFSALLDCLAGRE